MNNDIRIALAANLNRAADTLDRLAIRLADGHTRLDSLDESQAYIDAGAAIWEAALRGFLIVPDIVSRVENLALVGFPGPDTVTDNGMQSSNLFFGVMSDYIYPLGEAVAPYESLGNELPCRRTVDDKILFRRNELKCQATGCRILARLIEMDDFVPAATGQWFHTPDESRPDHFDFGPMTGTAIFLNECVGGKRDRNALQLHNKGRRGLLWIVKRDRTTCEVWFRWENELRAAKRRAEEATTPVDKI